MCYYSLSMRRGTFRSAKEGEDLVVSSLDGHGIVRAKDDGMVACVTGGIAVHMEAFNLTPHAEQAYATSYPRWRALFGKPVTARFCHGRTEAADSIIIEGVHVGLQHFKQGLVMYIGPKRPEPVTLETKLGVDDPSIVHDHKIDEVRTLTLVPRRSDMVAGD